MVKNDWKRTSIMEAIILVDRWPSLRHELQSHMDGMKLEDARLEVCPEAS